MDENEVGEEELVTEENRLKPQFADLPLCDVLKIQNEVGTKQFPKVVMTCTSQPERSHESKPKNPTKSVLKQKTLRQRIDGPKEEPIYSQPINTKKAVKTRKTSNSEPVRRDPRFDDLSGTFNQTFFDDEYSFLREIKRNELEEVKKNYKKCRDRDEKEKLHRLIQKYKEEEKRASRRDVEREILNEHVESEASKVEKGKKPFYMKKQQLKNRIKEEQIKRGLIKETKKQKMNRSMKEVQKSRRSFPERR